ncbi:MAG: hypothetical protein PVF15_09675 [Candidatus Bathyarchaeota archaeon]|jgi:hypothetical protein
MIAKIAKERRKRELATRITTPKATRLTQYTTTNPEYISFEVALKI